MPRPASARRGALIIGLAATWLAGCAAQAPQLITEPAAAAIPDPSSLPPATIGQAQARKTIAANRGRLFKDSDSVRDARIGDPFTCLSGSGNCICIEANARNSYGGMTGVELLVLKFPKTDAVEAIGTMYGPEHCGRLVPFPELNGRR